jgi:signal recognition particle subunit SRP54
MPGMAGGKRSGARQPAQVKGKKGKKRVSGNPAKAAQQAQRDDQETAAAGSAFGIPPELSAELPEDFDPSQLPDLSKYLK